MSDRLVATFVGLTLLVLALFALPAAYVVADVVQDQQEQSTARAADAVAAAVVERAEGLGVDASYLSTLVDPGERLVYVRPDGARVGAGDVAVDGPSSTVDLPGGGSLTLERSQRSVTDPVSDHVLPLALLAVLLSVAAGLLGVVAARRVTRPLDQLVGLAADLGAGRFDTAVPRSRVPEVDELGQALADAGRQLEQLVGRERTLAVNASHELRTPITALRLSLEDLTLWPQVTQDVREELERAIAEVDRLGVAVTELLEGRRDEAREAEVDVDLHAVACEAARSWRGRLAEQGRRLVLEESTPVPARIVVQPVQQVVDALVEHAATEGSGTVTLDVTALRTVLRVRVTDQGARRVPSGVLHGDDAHARAAGLAESATTVEALGGYLAAEDTGTSSLLLVLPRRPTDG